MLVCGNPEHEHGWSRQGLCKWPPGRVISFQWASGLGPFSLDDCEGIWLEAANEWAAVVPVSFRRAGAGEAPDVAVSVRSLGGSILAQATLPCGLFDSLWMEFNSDFSWSREMLKGVAVHGIGHTLGIGHAPGRGCVMSPAFEGPASFCDFDLAEARLRYGSVSPRGGGWGACEGLRFALLLLDLFFPEVSRVESRSSSDHGCGPR